MNGRHVRQLEAEHDRHLHRSFIVAIELARDAPASSVLHSMLVELADGLSLHMAMEEENLFPWLLSLLPHRAERVRALAHQHVEIARMTSMLEHAKFPPDAPVPAQYVELVKQFIRLMESHTQIENELTREADEVQEQGGPAAIAAAAIDPVTGS